MGHEFLRGDRGLKLTKICEIDICPCVGALFMLGLIFIEFIQTRLLLRKIDNDAAKFGTLQQKPSRIHDRWLVIRVTIPMVALR